MTIELQALFWATTILFLLLAVQGALVPVTQGFGWGLGSRDQPRDMSVLQGRMKRTVANHIEGLVIFASLVLIAHLAGISSSITQTGAMVFVVARIAFAFLYVLGVPFLRSVVWGASVLGLLMIASAVIPAVI